MTKSAQRNRGDRWGEQELHHASLKVTVTVIDPKILSVSVMVIDQYVMVISWLVELYKLEKFAVQQQTQIICIATDCRLTIKTNCVCLFFIIYNSKKNCSRQSIL